MIRQICNEISTRPRLLSSIDDATSSSAMPAGETKTNEDQDLSRGRDGESIASESKKLGDDASTRNVAGHIFVRQSSSFEERDGSRSAFQRIPSTEEQQPMKEDSTQPDIEIAAAKTGVKLNRSSPAEDIDQPLPFDSPIRYYHKQEAEKREQLMQAGSDSAVDVDAPCSFRYPTLPYQYQRPGPPESASSPTAMSFESYQGYPRQYYEGYGSHQYQYQYPPPQGVPHQGSYSDYSQNYHPGYYYPRTPHSTSMQDPREAPAAVTNSIKTSSETRASGGGSPPLPSFQDDRKPAAQDSTAPGKDPPVTQRGQHDFEPIPFKEVGTLPVHSPSLASQDPPSSHTCEYAFPQAASPPPQFMAPMKPSSHVDPPSSRSSSRRQRRHPTIAPTSSGSSRSNEGSWERRYGELDEFKRAHGHCEVPQNYPANTSLGTWVNKQRMEQKNRIDGRNSSLNDSRLQRLESIGFRWAKRKGQASWDEKYTELIAYNARFGNCHVPTKYKNNTALGRWVSTQRAEYRKYNEGQAKSSMNASKVRKLEEIGFAWFMAL